MSVLIKTDTWNPQTIGVVSCQNFLGFYPQFRESYRRWSALRSGGHANPCLGYDEGWKFYALPASERVKTTGYLCDAETCITLDKEPRVHFHHLQESGEIT